MDYDTWKIYGNRVKINGIYYDESELPFIEDENEEDETDEIGSVKNV